MSLASSTSLDLFWGSYYEPRNSVDWSYGCLEGPGIFLQSSILLRLHVCGEGEVSQSGFGRSWQLQKTNLESQDSFLGFLIVNKCYFLEYGQKTLE